jgi:hypothetical protein
MFCAAAVVLAACGGGAKKTISAVTTSTAAPVTTGVPAPATNGGAPLTGVTGGDPAKLGRPALIVKIDNAPNGRPQAGLNQADVVYEEGVEGGITRLAVIFHSQDVGAVGPVRSARSTDMLIASPLNKPLFAWSGANGDFVTLVRKSPVIDVGVDVKPAAYNRASNRPAPYNLMATGAKLYDGVQGGPPPSLFAYRAAGEAAAGEPKTKAHMQWKDKVQTLVDWEWDAAAGNWVRTENGTPHVDAAGARVTAKNVVIQLVTYHDTGYRDRSNTMVPEADLNGQGDVLVLTDGKLIKGKWAKPSADKLATYNDANGQPIKLTPGPTWVELPKPGDATVS